MKPPNTGFCSDCSDGKTLFVYLHLITVVSEPVAMALSAILLLPTSSMDTAHNNHHVSLVFRATTETPRALFSVSELNVPDWSSNFRDQLDAKIRLVLKVSSSSGPTAGAKYFSPFLN